MSKQEQPSPFEHLKITDAQYTPPDSNADERRTTITINNAECAVIITAPLGDYWYGGFHFYWHHGATSYKEPDPANGLFRSEREAMLYYIGYLSMYLDYFLDDTKESIREAMHEYSQQTLF